LRVPHPCVPCKGGSVAFPDFGFAGSSAVALAKAGSSAEALAKADAPSLRSSQGWVCRFSFPGASRAGGIVHPREPLDSRRPPSK
jgi:hypothetical protein